MIETSTFWMIVITILVSASILVTVFCIKTERDTLSLCIRLGATYILAALMLIVLLYPMNTTFEDGEIINNITNVEWNETKNYYSITTDKGDSYKIKNIMTSDSTFLSLDCKVINENILGMQLYTENDIIFINKADPNMSESEKNHTLDRLVAK